MKRLFLLILSFSFVVTSFTATTPLTVPSATASASDVFSSSGGEFADPSAMASVQPLEYAFHAPSAQWTNWVAGVAPATFSEDKITCKLADNVVLVDSSVSSKIATAGQLLSGSTQQKLLPNKIVSEGGYLPKATLNAAMPDGVKNGTVFVDESTGTAFKVVSPTVYTGLYDADPNLQETVKPLENTYALTRPALQEVIKEFKLEEDTISLTRGNISGFAPNIEKNMVLPGIIKPMAFKDSLKGFTTLSNNPLIKLQFTDEKLDALLGDGSPISVTVSGGIGIDNIDLTGRYTGFNGYRIAMTLKQESYLSVVLDAKLNQEIRIPILGIDVPFGIGRVTGGVFAIVGMNGTLRLEIDVRESTSTTLGVRGSTKFYVPTSAHPIFDQTFKSDGDVSLAGNVNGYLKFGPMMGIELFGFDLVGAGVFIGAGAHVQTEGKFLNIELYGIFNVYVKFAGEHFNLANYCPTILTKKQADTAGYRIDILEAFVKPGRVGGIIQSEVDFDKDPDGYEPAPDIEYRVLVVPEGESFNPNQVGDADKASIRKYPSVGYARTNEEGEFIQKDDQILYDGDRAYLEFKVGGVPYYSDPVSATLPFENITLTTADYFNDYATGKVQPVRVINWDAKNTDPPEMQYELAYYSNGLVFVNPYQSDPKLGDIPGGQAATRTDELGNFDTRKPLVSIVTGKPIPNSIDIRPTYQPDFSWRWAIFDLSILHNEARLTKRVTSFRPTMSLSVTRVVDEVADSYQKFEENGKLVNQMSYDEYIWIINPNGTRTVSDEEFSSIVWGFSTQDALYRQDHSYLDSVVMKQWDDTRPVSYQKSITKGLTPVLDDEGNPTGSAFYSQRVTVEWVWQNHPNPVKITSDNHTEVPASGGSFQVKASGWAPFAYSLIKAPAGVTINKSTGKITIPAGLSAQDYIFTIRVAEDHTLAIQKPLGGSDPYLGNDASPPAEQSFKLTVTGQSPSRTAPALAQESHGYQFKKVVGSGDLILQIKASGSTPITYSLQKNPAQITIDPKTGLLTVKDGIGKGAYTFTIQATNDVGSDTQDCTLTVTEPTQSRTAPVLSQESHGYQFTKVVGSGDLTLPVNATGSSPITYSLQKKSERYTIPSQVSIDPATGTLTIKEGISKGTYYFIIKATNDVGSDARECTLTVSDPVPSRTAPVLAEETHNYQFTKLINAGDLTVQIKASGSAPITYSLQKKSDRYVIPSQVSIDPNTGVLTIKDGIASGTYYFVIKASNDVGSDTQDCTLTVTAITLSRPRTAVNDTGLEWRQLTTTTNNTPANSVTIRWDHIADTYSKDRFSVTGAAYLHWDTTVNVSVEGAGIAAVLEDASPTCENYHYVEQVNVPQDLQNEIKNSFKEQLSDYQRTDIFLGKRLNSDTLLKEFNQFTVNPIGDSTFYLDYGSTLDAMKKQPGGAFLVELNNRTGTMVTGNYFEGLKQNSKATLSFLQEGVTVTFAGKNVKTDADTVNSMYNFGYTAKAPHEADILAAIGPGGENFTFGFAHHGALPGSASFAVSTPLAEGTLVNVYKFEGASGTFIQIAKGVPVGVKGVVTYQNNTMSEYLVTTKTLPDDVVAVMAQPVDSGPAAYWWVIVLALILVSAGAALWLTLRNKKKKQNGILTE